MILGWVCSGAFCVCYALTAWLLCHFRIRQIVDRPNPRSSHSTPTPRGGGLSMAAAMTSRAIILYAAGMLAAPLTTVLILGGLSVAAVGFWDDVRSAPIAVRMAVHVGAAVLAVYCLGGSSAVRVGDFIVDLGATRPGLEVVAIVWILNLFNFMDGIDGIAASEAACVLFGAAGLGVFVARGSLTEVAPELV